MAGKRVVLTGGTEGIGKAAAKALARMGPTLTLVGRDPAKTERVVAEVRQESGNPDVHAILADLSTLDGVRRVGDEVRARFDRVDVLANNAGALFTEHRLTPDGFERTFALNHLSYFLLTHELRPLLERAPGARVVSTSSGAHRGSRLTVESLPDVVKRPAGDAGFPAYADSKLLNILFTRELGRRLAGTGVTATCYHPGWVHTGFALNNEGWVKSFVGFAAPLFARTPEKGADTLVWLASSPDAAGLSGAYVFDRNEARPWPRGRDDALAAELWALSERVCGLS